MEVRTLEEIEEGLQAGGKSRSDLYGEKIKSQKIRGAMVSHDSGRRGCGLWPAHRTLGFNITELGAVPR